MCVAKKAAAIGRYPARIRSHGDLYEFDLGLSYYEIPYNEDEIAVVDPFDYDVVDDEISVN